MRQDQIDDYLKAHGITGTDAERVREGVAFYGRLPLTPSQMVSLPSGSCVHLYDSIYRGDLFIFWKSSQPEDWFESAGPRKRGTVQSMINNRMMAFNFHFCMWAANEEPGKGGGKYHE